MHQHRQYNLMKLLHPPKHLKEGTSFGAACMKGRALLVICLNKLVTASDSLVTRYPAHLTCCACMALMVNQQGSNFPLLSPAIPCS
jgi:hypothetical protein